MNGRWRLPQGVEIIMDGLHRKGYEGYVVGGCVRDRLRGETPKDWDICTSARPQEVRDCFPEYKAVETGLRYGTITLIVEGTPFEVTTFRVEGRYSDGRRPDRVGFVENLLQDLARRDLTINAMAYSREAGVVDPFHGTADLRAKLVRCVGEPEERFAEDGLRILRAMRFASVLDFDIEERTGEAILCLGGLLVKIAEERIQQEIRRLLTGAGAERVITGYSETLDVVLPEADWKTAAADMAGSPQDLTLRLAMLLRGAGAEAGTQGLRRLKFEVSTVESVQELLVHATEGIDPDPMRIKRWIGRLGEMQTKRLAYLVNRNEADRIVRMTDEILSGGGCCRVSDLAVSGRDLLETGWQQGPEMGMILETLLDLVMEGNAENTQETLLAEAKKRKPSDFQ